MKNKVLIKIYRKNKKTIRIILMVFTILLGISFVRNISRTISIEKKVREKEKRVEKLKEENEQLEKRLEEVSNDSYIERQLRDSLGLAKKGETVIILPDKEVLKSLAPKMEEEEDVLPDPNWKKWMELFI